MEKTEAELRRPKWEIWRLPFYLAKLHVWSVCARRFWRAGDKHRAYVAEHIFRALVKRGPIGLILLIALAGCASSWCPPTFTNGCPR